MARLLSVLSLAVVLSVAGAQAATAETPPPNEEQSAHEALAAQVRALTVRSRAGELEAHHELATMMWYGLGTKQQRDQAMTLYYAAAKGGYPPSLRKIGEMYAAGEGLPKDFTQAQKWYLRAAEKGDFPAMTWLGDQYGYGKDLPTDHKTAVRWYRQAAEGGDRRAQRMLGLQYLTGRGVEQSLEKATPWLMRAIEAGDDEAMFLLGIWGFDHVMQTMLQEPEQLKARMDEFFTIDRVKLVHQSADLGNVKAQGMLAQLYAVGMGVERHELKALVWGKLAQTGYSPDPGDETARRGLDTLLAGITEALTADERSESERQVAEWIKAHPHVTRVHSRVLDNGMVETKVWGTKKD